MDWQAVVFVFVRHAVSPAPNSPTNHPPSLQCAISGGKYSGAFLNPARVLGPVTVFKCSSSLTGLSILGQIFASCLSCFIFAFVSGLGPLHPLTSRKKLGLSNAEAVRMWMTGSPPARLATPGREDENVIELLKDMDTDEEIPAGGARSPRADAKQSGAGLSAEKV